MNKRNMLLFASTYLFCLMVSGCFYLRLQKVQGQLSEFDEYFEIKEDEKFCIIAKEPVLFPGDVVRIMNQKPSTEASGSDRLFYDYVLEKQYPGEKNEAGNYDISVRFVFIKDKLTESYIDKRFFTVIPKAMVLAILKAMGNAKVDIGKRRIYGGYGVAGEVHLPDANEVQMLLGSSYLREGNVCTYKYLRRSQQVTSVEKKDYLPAVFTFDDDGNFVKCRSEFLGGPIDIDFSLLLKNEKKPKANDSNSVQP
ncbi:MAG: hypothetical protein JXB29_06960 [Sedimentisphaerales bacterium]|nr:hypothetical protein [Sedimentisphaerales bacterium]